MHDRRAHEQNQPVSQANRDQPEVQTKQSQQETTDWPAEATKSPSLVNPSGKAPGLFSFHRHSHPSQITHVQCIVQAQLYASRINPS
jgi:hypothetical protein